MASLAFDTHAFVKDLTASGMPTEQAEVLARTYATLLTDRLATKDDIAGVKAEIAALDEKFTGEFMKVRGEIAAQEEKFDIKLSALEDRLTTRIALSQLATIIILSAVIGAFNVWG